MLGLSSGYRGYKALPPQQRSIAIAAGAVPVTVAIIQVLKGAFPGLPSRFWPLMSVAAGVGVGCWQRSCAGRLWADNSACGCGDGPGGWWGVFGG